MKQDLDRLMAERNLDAIYVSGKLNGNPPLFYMANGAKVISGTIVKKRGEPAKFICSPIDREVAAHSGLEVLTTNHFDYEVILREAPNELAARVELTCRIFDRLGITGNVGFYGMADQGSAYKFLNSLAERKSEISICGEYDKTILDVARATKDPAEAARIREVGRRTAWIVGKTVEFLQTHKVKDGRLMRGNEPLTIGMVHQEINRLLAEQGLDVPEGVIFAIGRDSGVPHNKGNAEDHLELGKSIIYDFGTREANGGYYYDMTRTFCLGWAPPEVEQAYQEVKEIQEKLLASYASGTSVRHYQRMANEYFESKGHPTTGSQPNTEIGFCHGLGHGIGLQVHEEPFFTDQPSNLNILQPGNIFTCEPGVYYPERGFGVRLEDVVWIDPQGKPVNLTDFPKQLVVEVG